MIPHKNIEQEKEHAVNQDVEGLQLNRKPQVAAHHLAVEVILNTVTIITVDSLGEISMVTSPGRIISCRKNEKN